MELAREAPGDVALVSESGLHTADDLRRLAACGYKGFLIGESLMRAPQPETALRSLLEKAGELPGSSRFSLRGRASNNLKVEL